MEKKTISKSIELNAPAERVWYTLTDDQSTRAWYSIFSEGTFAETNWKPGSKVIFRDSSGSGLIGKIIENRPHELLSVEYTGMLANGQEDYESKLAKDVQGGREIYRLSSSNNKTVLSIQCDMSEDMFDWMSSSWDQALQKIRDLAEGGTVMV